MVDRGRFDEPGVYEALRPAILAWRRFGVISGTGLPFIEIFPATCQCGAGRLCERNPVVSRRDHSVLGCAAEE